MAQSGWRSVTAGRWMLSHASELDSRMDTATTDQPTLDQKPNKEICILQAKLNPKCRHDRLTRRCLPMAVRGVEYERF